MRLRANFLVITYAGAGLGLSICLRAAKTNSGDIVVRDLPGKGCVFTLELPRRPTAALAEAP